jgi:GNAT superfamily N-acetyltransferase
VTGPGVQIRRAERCDAKAVADLLAGALWQTDVAHWLVPDRQERRRVYRAYFALFVPWFLDHGLVHYTEDGSGAAMWARLDGRFDPAIVDYDLRLMEACGDATPRFLSLDEAMFRHHPDREHWYLAFLVVDPDRQRQGIGSYLLHHHQSELDDAGVPAYLEATCRRNAALYARHGYVDRPAFLIEQHGPPLYPMWRDPAPDS